MDILISRTAATAEADLLATREADPEFGDRGLGYLFEYGTCAAIGTTPEAAGSLYVPRNGPRFDAVAIGRSIRLYRGTWTDSLLVYADRLVRDGGRLIFPVSKGTGELTTADATRLFGREPDAAKARDKRRSIVSYVHSGDLPAPPSTFSWYLGAAFELFEIALTDTSLERGARAEAVAALDRVRADPEAISQVPAALAAAFTNQAYYVGGICYKAPLLGFVRDTVAPERPWSRYVDIGGGYGLLAAEMLLQESSPPSAATNVDISPLNAAFSRPLSAAIAACGDRRLDFVLSGIETYRFGEPASAISFIGSLLYVPAPQRGAVVRAAFDALEPGGMLVIHENMRAPNYTLDHDIMFDPEELDALLEPLGAIRYFSSTSMDELEPAAVGRKTVFRVVERA